MMTTLVLTFLAGMASFLSPCVYPLVPGYLSYLAGVSLEETRRDPAARRRVAAHALAFILGFTVFFVMLGAVASAVGTALRSHQLLLEHGAGIVLVIFGLTMTGLVPLPFLRQDRRLFVTREHPALVRSGLIGIAFSIGWSPCITPLLGAAITLAASSSTLALGVAQLATYALGLGIPFMAAGLLIDRFGPMMRHARRLLRPVALVSGAILVVTGALVFSGHLAELLPTAAPL